MGTSQAAQFNLGANHVLRRIEGLKGGKTLLERWLQIGEEHKKCPACVRMMDDRELREFEKTVSRIGVSEVEEGLTGVC